MRLGAIALGMVLLAACERPRPRLAIAKHPDGHSIIDAAEQEASFDVDAAASEVRVGRDGDAARAPVHGQIVVWGLPCDGACDLRISVFLNVAQVEHGGHRAEKILTVLPDIAAKLDANGRLTLDGDAVQGGLNVTLDGQPMSLGITAPLAPDASLDARALAMDIALAWELPDDTPVHAKLRAVAKAFPPRARATATLECASDGGSIVLLDASGSTSMDGPIWPRTTWHFDLPDGGEAFLGRGMKLAIPAADAPNQASVFVMAKGGFSSATVQVPRAP